MRSRLEWLAGLGSGHGIVVSRHARPTRVASRNVPPLNAALLTDGHFCGTMRAIGTRIEAGRQSNPLTEIDFLRFESIEGGTHGSS